MIRIPRTIAPLVIGIASTAACGSATTNEPIGTLERATSRPLAVTDSSATTDAPVPSGLAEERSDSDVASAFEWLMLGRIECGRRPHECDVDRLAVPGSPVHDALTEVMADRIRYGIVASDRGAHRFRIDEIVPVALDEVSLRVCHSDDVVLTMAVAPGRPGAIFDEAWSSHWSIWTMKSIDGGWRWTEENVERRVYEEELCGL